MGDYYELKRKAYTNIENIIQKDHPERDSLVFDVVRGTGLSGKFVNAYIDELIKRGFVSEKEGMLSWVDDNDSKGQT